MRAACLADASVSCQYSNCSPCSRYHCCDGWHSSEKLSPEGATDGEVMAEADEIPDGDGHVPLPPEQPSAAPELSDDPLERADVEAAGFRPTSTDASEYVDGCSSTDAAPTDWWRGDDVREDLRGDCGEQASEASAAAHELGFQLQQAAGTISDAVAATAYPAAKERGLDFRWMRLSINAPAIVLALLATWGGRTATDRMVQTVAEDGLFAPLGVVLFFVLAGGLLLLTPIGTPLAQALAHVVTAVGQGLVSLVRRAWSAPVAGYLMRLVLAVFAWAFVFAVVRVAGRAILHWLTGV
jgi:hypothetical protein